ncbi:MAG: NFACT family protein [Armatimonadota bacterium]
MIYDALTMAACAAEMSQALTGMIVHQVRQPLELEVVLVCRAGGREAQALFSADARFARAHLTGIRRPVPPTPPHFCQLLRRHLEGRRVQSVRQEGKDRILRITFTGTDSESRTLVCEVMGRHSNIILLDGEGTILGAIKTVGARQSRARQILPGRLYEPPPTGRLELGDAGPQEFRRMWAEKFGENPGDPAEVAAWLVREFSGVSPALAAEAIHRAGNPEPDKVFRELEALLALIPDGPFAPVILQEPGHRIEEVYPVPLKHRTSAGQHPRPRISEALEHAVREEITARELEDERSQTLAAIRRSAERLREEIQELEAILQQPEEPDALRRMAENLAASYHLIQPGSSCVEVPDYFDPSMRPVSIELRPDLSPSENVERAFRKARRAADRIQHAEERLPTLRRDLATLEETCRQVEESASVAEIRERRAALENARLLPPPQATGPAEAKERPFEGHRIRTVISEDGLEILYGETAEANDYLTQKVARPDDVWLHARSVTGAHVIIRTGKGRTAPPATLRQAAEIAARNSAARHSSYIPVDWTLRKYVRKPKGSPPGLATYTHEKTIHITGGS